MAENQVLWRDNQEVQSADLSNASQWDSDALDHVVFDAISADMAYSGFLISQVAPTQISIAPGRLYSQGAVYANINPSVIDLFNVLPVTQKKQVAVVCWGTTIQQDIQPRDFIIDADTGQSQPQSVAMQQTRYCNVDVVAGIEAPSPTYPPVDATDLLIGYVLVGPTGIISFQQATQNHIDSVEDLSNRMDSVEAFEAQVEGQIATLTTALANLAKQFANYVLLTDYQKLVALVAQIWDLIHKPAAYLWYGTDYFLDYTLSLPAANRPPTGTMSAWTATNMFGTGILESTFNAVVEEGLRFPPTGTSSIATLALNNPSDPTVVVAVDGSTSMIIPTPSGSRVRLDCSFPNLPWIEERILQYVGFSCAIRKLKPSRHRHRCGPPWLPCDQSQVWWYQAQVDPTFHIMSYLAETWEINSWANIAMHAADDDPDYPQHQFSRLKYFWHDCVDLPYWSKVYDPYTKTSTHIAQTFLNGQDGWLTSVTLHLYKNLGAAMTVFISICDPDGTPNPQNVVGYVDCSDSAIASGILTPIKVGDVEEFITVSTPLPSWKKHTSTIVVDIPVYIYPCRIDIPPTFLQAGRRYALHVTTANDHSFCITDQWDAVAIHQGDYWISNSNGLYIWPSRTTPRSLRFQLHFATWGQWQGTTSPTGGSARAIVQMQTLQQSGGIGGIDILADSIIPPATSISYQVLIAGVWTAFGADTDAPNLSSYPASLQFQTVFTGTTDLMPALSLAQSQVTLQGGIGGALHHISEELVLASSETSVKVTVNMVNFLGTLYGGPANTGTAHALFCGLHYTTAGPTQVQKTPDVGPTDVVNPDGSISRTWVFNTAGAIYGTSDHGCYVELYGTNNGTQRPFVVAQEVRFVQP